MSGFQFIEADQPIPPKPLFLVLAGLPGIGKTSTAFTVRNAFCLDADMGVARAVQKKRPGLYTVTDYALFKGYAFSPDFEAKVKQAGIETVIIDTVGAFLDDVIAPYLIRSNHQYGSSGGLSQRGWGALNAEFNSFVNRCFSLGLNIIAVTHGKDDEDEATKNKTINLAVKGGSKDLILRKADMVGFIMLRNGQSVLDFNKSAHTLVAKNTAGLAPLALPHRDTPEYDLFLQSVLDATKQKMAEFSETQIAALKLQTELLDLISELTSLADVPQLQARIEAVDNHMVRQAALSVLAGRYAEIVLDGFEPKTAKQVNEFVKALSAHPDAYKKVIWGRLVEAAREHGFTYDKTSKTFKAVKGEPEQTETTEQNEATDGEG
jgi:hypothetical protein